MQHAITFLYFTHFHAEKYLYKRSFPFLWKYLRLSFTSNITHFFFFYSVYSHRTLIKFVTNVVYPTFDIKHTWNTGTNDHEEENIKHWKNILWKKKQKRSPKYQHVCAWLNVDEYTQTQIKHVAFFYSPMGIHILISLYTKPTNLILYYIQCAYTSKRICDSVVFCRHYKIK